MKAHLFEGPCHGMEFEVDNVQGERRVDFTVDEYGPTPFVATYRRVGWLHETLIYVYEGMERGL